MKFRLTLLTLSTTLAFSTLAHSQDFSQTIFFGDSLTDSGSYLKLGANKDGSTNSFTTNPDPVWAEVLADSYNSKAISTANKDFEGTNYAEGGAKTEEVVWISFFSSISPTKNQIKNYLDAHDQKADPKALYSLWIGANDLMGLDTSKPLEALNEIGIRANYTAEQFEQLNQAGAKYILAPNLPNVGLAPDYVKDESKKNKATQGVKLYNNILFSTLNRGDANVIPVDTFTLLTEVINDPVAFSFDKDKVQERICSKNWIIPDSLTCVQDQDGKINGDDPEAYIFADGIHPTGHTHRVLAQYARSIIEAPQPIGLIPKSILNDGIQSNHEMNLRLNKLTPNQNNWWVDLNGSKNDLNDINSENINPGLSLGADIAGNNTNTGIYAKYRQQEQALGSKNTIANTKEYGVGLYHRYQPNNFRLNLHGGIDRLDIETSREVEWEGPARQHTAQAKGSHAYASLQGSYLYNLNKISYQPYIGVNTQHVRVNHLVEDTTQSTAMNFDKQKQNSTQGELGLNIAYQATDSTNLYAGVGYVREFDQDDGYITASLNSMPEYSKGFTLPVNNKLNKESVNASIGVKKYLTPSLNINAGVSANRIDSDQNSVSGFVGLQGQF